MKTIPLTRGFVAEIDDEDYKRVVRFKWYAWRNSTSGIVYARRKANLQGVMFMHRYILGLKWGDGKLVDHINGDGLDNKKDNIRIVSRSQNVKNRR